MSSAYTPYWIYLKKKQPFTTHYTRSPTRLRPNGRTERKRLDAKGLWITGNENSPILSWICPICCDGGPIGPDFFS